MTTTNVISAPGLVTIVEDDAEARRACVELLEHHGCQVSAYADGTSFLDAFLGRGPGCIILDLRLPDISGLQVLEQLRQRTEHVSPIVFITAHGDVQAAVQAMKDTLVVDFLTKPFVPSELLRVVDQAIEHDRATLEQRDRRADIAERLDRLSGRERQVLGALMRGKSNKQIALELDLSHKTVSTHRTHMLEKFGVTSIVDVTRMLESAGLVVDETGVQDAAADPPAAEVQVTAGMAAPRATMPGDAAG